MPAYMRRCVAVWKDAYGEGGAELASFHWPAREGRGVMDYETRTLSILVAPKDQPTFSEYATEIKIVDEAAGEFLEVSNLAD